MEDATMEEKKTVDASPPSSSHDKNAKVKQSPQPQQDTTHNKTLVPSSSTLAASCDTMLLDSMDQCVGYVEDVDGQQRFDEAMTMTTNMRLGKNKQSSETKTPPEDSHNNNHNNNSNHNMLMTAVCGTDMEDLLVASALFLATSPTDTTLPTTTTFQGPKNKGTTHCRQRSLVDGDGGGGGCCMICHQLPQPPPPPPSSNSTAEEQSDGQVVGVYELPCCGNHQCWNCVTILTLPVNNKEFRIGMCPHCRTWLQIMAEKTIQLLPETTTTATTTTTTCSHCCQVKQPLIPDVDNIVTTLPMTSVLDHDEDEPDNNAKDIIKETKTKTKLVVLCDACCLAKHAPLIYECQTCHVSQRIAAPLYRCQPTPLEFFTQDHQQQLFGPCQNCAHTHDHGHSAEDTQVEEENLTSPKKTEERDATTTTTTGWRLRFDQILAIRAHDVPLAWGNEVAWRVAQLRVLAVQQGLLPLDLDTHYDTTKTTTDDEDHQKAMTLESLISSLLLSSTSQHKNQENISPTNDHHHHHPASQQDAPSNDPAATSRTTSKTDSPMKETPSSSPQLDGGQQDPSSQTAAATLSSSGNDDCIIL